jgi:hypothetical protein
VAAAAVCVAGFGCGDDETTGPSGTSHHQGGGGAGASGGGGSGGGGDGGTGGDGGGVGTGPAAPSNLTVEPLGGGLHVTWMDNSDDEDNFVLERHDGSGTFVEVITLPFDSDNYHDEGTLVSGTEYTYRAGAINAEGTTYSEEASNTAP